MAIDRYTVAVAGPGAGRRIRLVSANWARGRDRRRRPDLQGRAGLGQLRARGAAGLPAARRRRARPRPPDRLGPPDRQRLVEQRGAGGRGRHAARGGARSAPRSRPEGAALPARGERDRGDALRDHGPVRVRDGARGALLLLDCRSQEIAHADGRSIGVGADRQQRSPPRAGGRGVRPAAGVLAREAACALGVDTLRDATLEWLEAARGPAAGAGRPPRAARGDRGRAHDRGHPDDPAGPLVGRGPADVRQPRLAARRLRGELPGARRARAMLPRAGRGRRGLRGAA